MKAFRILTTVISLGIILVFSGCGGKSSPAESTQEKQLKLLKQTWKIGTVTLNTVDQTKSWTGFALAISGDPTATTYNYSCASQLKPGPWPASGTWAFPTAANSDPVTQIIRDPGAAGSSTAGAELAMTYTVTATTLQVTFNYTGNGYSRVSNLSGNWIFNFTL